jgi:spermidine synthase
MNFLAKWRVRKPADDSETVYISERYGVRSLHIGSDTIQSSMRLARPNDLELSYTRSMMAFLLFGPPPQRVLMIGLGGGSLAKFVHDRLHSSTTQVIEVNPRVVSLTMARRMCSEKTSARMCSSSMVTRAIHTSRRLRIELFIVRAGRG